MKTDLSKSQMVRKIRNAVVFVPKDKDTKSIFFSDKGLRLSVTSEYAVVSTAFHSHVFYNSTKPYIFMSKLVDISMSNDCIDGDGYSFTKLLENLQAKEEKTEYNITMYISWWLFNIFSPLYTIGESRADNTIVFLDYAHNLAKNSALLSERDGELTEKKLLELYKKTFDELTAVFGDEVIVENKDDSDFGLEDIAGQESAGV